MRSVIIAAILFFSCNNKMKYSAYESQAGFNYTEDVITEFDSTIVNKQFDFTDEQN